MRRWSGLVLQCCAVVAVVALPAAAQPPVSFSADRLMDHVRVLAGQPLQGRRAGTPFERRAADYLARQLDALQIQPLPNGERLQTFPLVVGPSVAEQEPPTSLNVLGYIAPIVRREDEGLIVLGAHFDHLGQTGDGGYFPGADDNASGVALVLEVARELSHQRRGLRRGVVIAFFGAEECGLIGSRWFVQHGPIKAADIVTMVNVDMIGRPLVDQQQLELAKKLLRVDSARSLGVVGTKGRPAFAQLVNSSCRRAELVPYGTQTMLAPIVENLARNRADHACFEQVGIPTLFFGSGESDDYHKPSDTIDKLVPELMARRAQVVFEVVLSLAQQERDELPAHQQPETEKARPEKQEDEAAQLKSSQPI